jgi:translation initiation factor IF-1
MEEQSDIVLIPKVGTVVSFLLAGWLIDIRLEDGSIVRAKIPKTTIRKLGIIRIVPGDRLQVVLLKNGFWRVVGFARP